MDSYPGRDQLSRWHMQWLPETQRFVYVVAGDDAPPIKVGVAKNPLARMASLQQGNPQRLRLLYVLPGGHKLEADFHRRLESAGIHGEWFGGEEAAAFLDWMADASERAFEIHERTGKLPTALPPLRRLDRKPIGTGYTTFRREMGHVWRTTDKPTQNPVTVRFVDPATLRAD